MAVIHDIAEGSTLFPLLCGYAHQLSFKQSHELHITQISLILSSCKVCVQLIYYATVTCGYISETYQEFLICTTAIVGDITPIDNVTKEEKNRLETAAIEEMCQLLEGGIAGMKKDNMISLI